MRGTGGSRDPLVTGSEPRPALPDRARFSEPAPRPPHRRTVEPIEDSDIWTDIKSLADKKEIPGFRCISLDFATNP